MFFKFCSIFFALAMSNFGFVSGRKFQTPLQKFDFNLYKFEFETEIANIQYSISQWLTSYHCKKSCDTGLLPEYNH